MTDGLVLGRPVTVRVPASSANLGPGFDSLGLALDLHDEVTVEAFAPFDGPSVLIDVEGAGAGAVPRGETHLVVRQVRAGLAHAGVASRPDQVGLRLACRNVIPHGRGLGSSAAAIVAGLVAAQGLLADASVLDDAALLDLASTAEGHPDNASAALVGGLTVAWMDDAPGRGGVRRAGAVTVPVHPQVRAVVCVPHGELATSTARAMLPTHVPHGDAAFNAGRAALLVEAVSRRPDLLLEATRDRLHQDQRASAMPATAALVAAVRARGGAAVVSGAGPCVLVLGVGDAPLAAVREALADVAAGAGPGGSGEDAWQVLTPAVDTTGARRVATAAPRRSEVA